jgi:Ca2+-binding RTX toxin-like protein
MAISTNGTIITRLAGALYNEYLSNASYVELNTTAASTVAANMLTNDFAGKTDAQLATTILTNLGLTSITGLNNWVAGQLTAAGTTAAAKGAKLVSMLNDFAMMTADTTYGTYATSFNAKTEASLVKSQTTGSKSGSFATSDVVAITNATLPLTAGVDTTLVGGTGNDTFTASGTTLTAGDVLAGGTGADTLQITTTALASVGTGVITTSVETISATATVGTLTVDASTMAGVTNVTNSGSTTPVVVTGLAAIPVVNVTATNVDTTVTETALAVAGATDAMTINLNGAGTTANVNINVDGIEILNVAANGTASGSKTSTVSLVSNAAVTTLNVSGTAGAKLAANLSGATATVTGTVTSAEGGDDVAITADATDKLSVNMGAGNDTVRIGNIAAIHTLVGGDGTDTLISTAAITTTTGANISGFEAVSVGAVSVALPTATNTLSGVTFTSTGGTVTGLAAGGVITQEAGGTNTVVNTGWTGAADALTVNFGTATSTALTAQSLTATLALEEVTINNLQLSTDVSARTVGATGDALKTLNVNSAGAAPVIIAGGGAALTKVNAAGVGGNVTISAIVATAGSELIGGSGNDILAGAAGVDTLTGGAGNDSLTGAAGNDVLSGGLGADTLAGGVGVDALTGGDGADVFSFGANATGLLESSAAAMDTISDFVSGSDRILTSQSNTSFVGNVANIQLGLAGMTGANQSFFVTTENTLYVVATQGTLSNLDTTIKLTGITSLTAADVGQGAQAGGADLTLSAVNTFTATALSTGGNVFTAADDTIRTTSLQFLEATTLTGGNGTDTIAITAGAAATGLTAAEAINITGFESMTLGDNTVVGGASITAAIEWDDVNTPSGTFTFNATGLTTIASNFTGVAIDGTNNGTGTLNLTGSNFTGAGDTLVGGSFNDTINGGAGNDTITGGLGNDSLSGGIGDDTIVAAGTDTIDGGVGNDTVQVAAAIGTSTTNLATIELGAGVNQVAYTANAASTALASIVSTGGVYGITIANGVSTATMTPAQFSGAYQAVGVNAGAAEGITFSTNGTINASAVTDIINLNLSAGTTGSGANTLTVTTISTSITGAGGADTINVAGGTAAQAVLAGTIIGGAGTDVINVTGDTATTVTLSANTNTIETINFASLTQNVSLTTNNANLTAATQTLTVTMPSTSTGTLTFAGGGETEGNYSVVGATGADVLTGGAGNDTLTANDGANTVFGGAGNDTISSGSGIDRLYGDNGGTKTVTTIIITDTVNGELVSGEVFTVTIDGIATAYTATVADVGGDLSSDVLNTMVSLVGAINANTQLAGIVTATAPTVTTTTGSATGTLTFIADGVHTLAFTRGAATASITATTATGTAGTAGTVGDDIITGGAGADLIFGGGGVDTLTGDAGIDRFFFLNGQARLSSLPTITDYRSATGNNAGALDTILIGDQVVVAGTTATVQDLSTSASLGTALNAAANTNTQAMGLSVFMWGGSTYFYVEAVNATTFVTTDTLIKITGTPYTTATAIAGLGFDGV